MAYGCAVLNTGISLTMHTYYSRYLDGTLICLPDLVMVGSTLLLWLLVVAVACGSGLSSSRAGGLTDVGER